MEDCRQGRRAIAQVILNQLSLGQTMATCNPGPIATCATSGVLLTDIIRRTTPQASAADALSQAINASNAGLFSWASGHTR